MLPREAANIHPENHNILVFLSNTVFPPFYVTSPSLFPILENGRYLGGTWEEHGRNVFVLPSLLLCFPIDTKAKFYRRSIEHLSKTYRTPIEELSKTYRTSIEEIMGQISYPLPIWFVSYAQKKVCQYFPSFVTVCTINPLVR